MMSSTNSVNSECLRAVAKARSCAICSLENSGVSIVPDVCVLVLRAVEYTTLATKRFEAHQGRDLRFVGFFTSYGTRGG